MNHFARICQSSKKKVHVPEEVDGYESEESLLQLEEITVISGSGNQLTSSITFIVDQKYKACVSIGHWSNLLCNQSQKPGSTTPEW